MFKLARWSYLIYAALAALITAAKGFFYAHLLDAVQYAHVNYYLLILGVGVLLVGSGVIVRCHTELPLLVKGPREVLERFVGQVKGTGLLCWLVMCGVFPFLGKAIDLDVRLQVLSLLQVLIFFLFTVDLMLIKGRLDFAGYARQLFVRNAVIAACGFLVAYLTGDALRTVLAEVVCAVLFYGRGLYALLRGLRMPGVVFLHQSIAFMPVTLVGALLQFSDRLLGSSLLDTQTFSRFSYFALVVMAGMSLQQLVNTRVITVLPEICQRRSSDGFAYALKVALGMSALLLAGLPMGMFFLQSPWFAASWVQQDYVLGGLFVLIAWARSVDFFSSYLLVMGRKRLLFFLQSSALLFFAVVFLFCRLVKTVTLYEFLILVFIGYFALLLSMLFSAWSIRNAGEVVK
ncbi:hypothetical protein [Pseudomonas xanthosomatis]|uniref:hypothetical protein n=1 Tax=Pseudomonas xanthosomatis TaxID=2842356 RepID=UPI00351194CF